MSSGSSTICCEDTVTTAPRRLRAHAAAWPLAEVFTISRGSKTQSEVVIAEIEADGIVGRGECVPYPRYGETISSVLEALRGAEAIVAAGGSRNALLDALPAGAARNALDCALWDLEAKTSDKRVWELADSPAPDPVVTAYTLSLDTPDAMGESARRHSNRPLLKLKLDRTDTLARVEAVRENAPNSSLIVDANEAWQMTDLEAWLPRLAQLGVELVEQPLPAGQDGDLRKLDSPVPIGADESCHVCDDLDSLRERYQTVNIKLDKTGGLTEALRLRAAAVDSGMDFMIGCMVGTSLSMAPATLLTPGARFVDLDGPLLLAQDRMPGLKYDGAMVNPPTRELWG